MTWLHLSDSTPVARKPHRCSWCGEPIHAGDRYACSTGLWEGELITNRMHPECDAAAQDDYDEYGEGFELYGNPRPAPSASDAPVKP